MTNASQQSSDTLLAYAQCLLSTQSTQSCGWGPSTLLDLTSITMPSYPVMGLVVLLYITVLQILRHRQEKQITAFVAGNMPLQPEPAQQALIKLISLEFPMIHKVALQFALFRTYGIPTISGLLRDTTLFTSPETAARRYTDTSVLITEFVARKYGTEDWIQPMARTNAIHGHYREKGKILEADMLYTLLLFAQQPWKWIDRYDWRSLTEAELNVLGTYWRSIGEAMEIDYTGLQVPGWVEDKAASMTANGRGRAEWKHGADWLRAVNAWAEAYERKYMVPSDSNAEVAEQTIALLLYDVPKTFHPLGRHVVSSFMDQRLRRAMRIADPPIAIHCTIHTLLAVRKIVVRYLMPPRPNFLKVRTITELEDKTPEGRHHQLEYDNMPYYVKPTLANRWSPRAWLRWLTGKSLPGDDGMNPEGYFSNRLGPPVGRASKEQEKREKMVTDVLRGQGCPMAFR